jgi:hypothetical protein
MDDRTLLSLAEKLSDYEQWPFSAQERKCYVYGVMVSASRVNDSGYEAISDIWKELTIEADIEFKAEQAERLARAGILGAVT